MGAGPTLVWFRQDLRLEDQPALVSAAERGGVVVPVFIQAPGEDGRWAPGAASRWWLHHSLAALAEELGRLKIRLILRQGDWLTELRSLIRETGAEAVYWCGRYEPAAVARDVKIKAALEREGIAVRTFNGSLLYEPSDLRTKSGGPFRVFTPFWKACLSRPEPDPPLAAPSKLRGPQRWPKSCGLGELKLLPSIGWAKGLSQAWTPGSAGGQVVLARFLEQALARYDRDRDRPAVVGTSRLSPHLHWGEISVREVWQAVGDVAGRGRDKRLRACAQAYLRELGWREFGHHLLVHFPRTQDRPLRPEFEQFPWRRDAKALRAWQRGRTGYPIVDAGMRELWRTGWMHNRVRMIAASFLVKDLLLPWQQGAKWFWDTLVDADLANNTLGWQWSAGCGADAAPYFRVFNPVSQSRKFDPDGDYVRKWIPSLRSVPSEHIHEPQNAERDRAGGYPGPIVDHAEARKRVLAAFAAIRKRR